MGLHPAGRHASTTAPSVPAAVASSGDADVAGLPNNAAGFAQAFVRLRDKYAPNVLLGYELSMWGTKTDPIYQNIPLAQIDALADRSTAFEQSLGARLRPRLHRPGRPRRRLRPVRQRRRRQELVGRHRLRPLRPVRGRLRPRHRPAHGAVADTAGQHEDAGHEQHLGPLPGQPRRVVVRRRDRDAPGHDRCGRGDRDALRWRRGWHHLRGRRWGLLPRAGQRLLRRRAAPPADSRVDDLRRHHLLPAHSRPHPRHPQRQRPERVSSQTTWPAPSR